MIDLFLAEGPNARLRKAHIVEAANLQLKGQVMAEAAYKKVIMLTVIMIMIMGISYLRSSNKFYFRLRYEP